MRSIVVCLCVLSSACTGQALNSPTSPTAAANVSAATSLTGPALPFHGSLTANEVDVVSFPTLLAKGSAEGTATHLGRYAAEFNANVNVLDGTSTGSFTFTAANGDQLFATFVGLGVGEPIANITETLTITGGTGRLVGASGTVVVRRTLDLTTGVSSGAMDGSITMQH
jgi:hypothetical protein